MQTIKNAEIDLDFPLCKYFIRENITRDTLIIILLIEQGGPTVHTTVYRTAGVNFKNHLLKRKNSSSFLLKKEEILIKVN